MNFQNILTDIEKIDPEVYDRLDTRRASLRSFSGIGKKLTLAALPLALGGMFKKAYGQTGSTTLSIVDVLNYALTLEYLESKFYANALGAAGLIASSEISSISTIAGHEAAHVAVLTQTITSLGGTPVSEPEFDFTAAGTFPDVFATKDFGTFLALAQTFEDTGVRAYKGQANNANLMANNDVLTAALNIHSVEARHAAHIRQLRRSRGEDSNTKPWITGKSIGTLPSGVQSSYDGEDNVVQGGTVTITSLPGASGNISVNAATEAFDEALTRDAVLVIVGPFIK